MKCVSMIAERFEPFSNFFVEIGAGGDRLNGGAGNMHSHLAALANVVVNMNIRQFYSSLESVNTRLSSVLNKWPDDGIQIQELIANIDSFSTSFDRFIAGQIGTNAAPLILKARVLDVRLSSFCDALRLTNGALNSQLTNPLRHTELSILLPLPLNLHDFAEKLLALESIYDELCHLLNVSLASDPIQIGKIESGSLWAKVFGNSKVIGLLTDLTKAAASFIYRTYTTEGKLSAIPRKVESIDAILGLSRRLQEEGVNTSELNDHLAKASVSLAKGLNTLLEGQPKIAINDQTYSIGTELQNQLEEPNSPLKLAYKLDQSAPDQDPD